MGREYAGLVLENTDKGLVLSQVECDRADKGKPEDVNTADPLSQNTVYQKERKNRDRKKNGWRGFMFTNQDLKKLIIPLFLEQLLVALVGIADVFVIGFFGEAAVSGVSLVNAFKR